MSNYQRLKAAETKLGELGAFELLLSKEGGFGDDDLEDLRIGLLKVVPNVRRVGILGGSELHKNVLIDYNRLRDYLPSRMQIGIPPIRA